MSGLLIYRELKYEDSHLALLRVPLLHPGPLGGVEGVEGGGGVAPHPRHVVGQQRRPRPLARLALALLLGPLGGLGLGEVRLGLAHHVHIQHLPTQRLPVLAQAGGPRIERRGELYECIALHIAHCIEVGLGFIGLNCRVHRHAAAWSLQLTLCIDIPAIRPYF